MAKILVEIPDDLYNEIKQTQMFISGMRSGKTLLYTLMSSVANGIPLPKGHGDLIDRSMIYKAIPAEEDNCTGMGMTFEEMDAYNEGIDAMYSLVRGAKPIIEADKEGD